ncbi:MAG: DUF2284 domain-containing protein [Deltaproteobacteria bacterium]|nr:DUF2284 domain-containing protein [Deltaproteobacteria bacterium]
MVNHLEIETLLAEHSFTDYKWMKPENIIVAQWVRMKCMFGCDNYGRAPCPPNMPPVSDCRRFFDEYSEAVILHFHKKVDRPEDRRAWSKKVNLDLLKLERAVFLTGYPKTFLIFMSPCSFCADCSGSREECKILGSARPTPEAMAVDVYSTVRQYDYPLEVLPDYSQAMNRYAFLLIE